MLRQGATYPARLRLAVHYMLQVVAFPSTGSLLNLSPLLKNTVMEVFLVLLYGPETAQVPPVLPVAVIALAVESLILVLLRLEVVFLQYW